MTCPLYVLCTGTRVCTLLISNLQVYILLNNIINWMIKCRSIADSRIFACSYATSWLHAERNARDKQGIDDNTYYTDHRSIIIIDHFGARGRRWNGWPVGPVRSFPSGGQEENFENLFENILPSHDCLLSPAWHISDTLTPPGVVGHVITRVVG